MACIILFFLIAVYEIFPQFRLPFDDISLRTPIGFGSSSYSDRGYIGNAIYSNASIPNALNFIGEFAYDCFGSQDLCIEGFSMFLWIMAPSYTYDYTILSAVNQNTGILIDFRTSDFSLSNKFWITVRYGTTMEDHYPFELEPDVWSHLGITWYINGTRFFSVNGVFLDALQQRSITLISTLDPVAKLVFGQNLTLTSLPNYCKGGLDEFLIVRHPIDVTDLIKFYGRFL